MSTADLFRPGYVIVERRWQPVKTNKRSKRSRVGWTEHRADCRHLNRASRNVQPAPIEQYPDTVNCMECRPRDEHQPTRKRDADGVVIQIDCSCGISVSGASPEALRHRLIAAHKRAAAGQGGGETDARSTA